MLIGVEFGGAIGFLFYLGTAIASSMYVLGAVESIQTGFGASDMFPFDTQVMALCLALLLACIVAGSPPSLLFCYFFIFVVL